MSFFTIPDINNTPVMINTKLIEYISIEFDNRISVHFQSGNIIETSMPRQILVQMLNKVDRKPEIVQPTQEFAG